MNWCELCGREKDENGHCIFADNCKTGEGERAPSKFRESEDVRRLRPDYINSHGCRRMRIDSVKETTVICVSMVAGLGISEDPVREVWIYYLPDGTFIGERDSAAIEEGNQ